MGRFTDAIKHWSDQIAADKEQLADYEAGRAETFDINDDGRTNTTDETVSSLRASIDRLKRHVKAMAENNDD